MRHVAAVLLVLTGCAIGRESLVTSMKTHGDTIIPEAIALYEGAPAPANASDRLGKLQVWKADIRTLREEAESAAQKQFAERMARPSRILFPEIEKLYRGENLGLDLDQVRRRVRLLKEWHETIRAANE